MIMSLKLCNNDLCKSVFYVKTCAFVAGWYHDAGDAAESADGKNNNNARARRELVQKQSVSHQERTLRQTYNRYIGLRHQSDHHVGIR